MIKVTFTLDDQSVAYLDRMADRLAKPKSQVVREALRLYGEHMSRLTDEERTHMLADFDRLTPAIPDRPREDVEHELDELRRARESGGRAALEAQADPE